VQVACKVEILCDADNCIQPVCFTKYVGLDIFMPDKHQITSSSIMHLGVGEEKEIYDVFIHLVELDEDGVALLYVRTKNIDSHPIPINTTIPRNKATLFDGASWQCYGHDGISTGTISETCQTSEYWQKLAENSCNDVCNPVLGKCGVNSFTVGESCKKAVKGKPTEVIGVKITPLPDYKDPVVSPACTGCNKDDKCYPIGYRQSGEFCSHVDVFKVQLGSDSACDNNFECSSNVCVANKCVSPSMLENIFSWFKKTPWKN
jgi:hypothetical protein